VTQVFARSPEAKGRVERMAGTFQDRLVTELRLAGAGTMDEANRALREFLPRFNEHFQVPAVQPTSAYHQVDAETDLGAILCFKHSCKVARDNTVKHQYRSLNNHDGPSTLRRIWIWAGSRPNRIIAHLAFYAPWVLSPPARCDSFLQDFIEDSLMQGFPVLRGKKRWGCPVSVLPRGRHGRMTACLGQRLP